MDKNNQSVPQEEVQENDVQEKDVQENIEEAKATNEDLEKAAETVQEQVMKELNKIADTENTSQDE